jgi:hypothetical protein
VEGPEESAIKPDDDSGDAKKRGFLEAAADILHPESGFTMTVPKKEGSGD